MFMGFVLPLGLRRGGATLLTTAANITGLVPLDSMSSTSLDECTLYHKGLMGYMQSMYSVALCFRGILYFNA